MKRILALALGLVMIVALLAACAPATTDDPPYNDTQNDTQNEVPQWDWDFDELVMATNAAFPPFEFVDDDGNYAGFDVDIANALADRLGLTLRIDNMAFDAIITAVQTGPGNVVGIAAITITEERAQVINFTMPYFETELVVIVREDSDIMTHDDIEGRDVGVQLGTTSDLFVENSARFDEDQIDVLRLQNPPDLIPALNVGQVDLVIIDREVALQFINDFPGLRMLEEPIGQDTYGIVVQQGQEALLAALNSALAEMKADGTYDAIFDYWFGGGEADYDYGEYDHGYDDYDNDNEAYEEE